MGKHTIEVMSRHAAACVTREKTASSTAIISITDCGSALNSFHILGWLEGVLALQFDDVESGHNCISVSQAAEVAEFVLRVKKDVERIIVHCEFGQSRSAGIAAAIGRHRRGSL